MLVVQRDKPGSIAGRDGGGGSLRESVEQRAQVGWGVGDGIQVREEGVDLAMIGRVQTRLDAVQQIKPAILPGWVHEREGQVNEALQPLLVGHGLDVTEIRLGGLGQRGDDLVAVILILSRIQRGDQPGGSGEGVIDFVEIRQQVRLPGSHTTVGATAADPTAIGIRADTRGVNEQLFDLRGSGGFFGGHGDRADEYAIDRHARQRILLRPRTSQVFRSTFRRVNATADGDGDVIALAGSGVGVDKHLIQIQPRVVAAGVAVLDLQNQLVLRVGVCNGQDVADLLGGARFEGNIWETVGAQLREQFGGFVGFRYTSRNGDTSNRCAVRAGLRDDARLAKLQVPHEAIEEHGVKGDGASRLQLADQRILQFRKQLFGIHSAAGHLRPETGIGSSGHDGWVDGGWRHAAEHDRGQTGQCRELRLRVRLAIRQCDQARGELGPVARSRQLRAGGSEVIALRRRPRRNHGQAGARHERCGEFGQAVVKHQGVADLLVDHPGGLGGPVEWVDQDLADDGGDIGVAEVQLAGLSPLDGEVCGFGEAVVVERQRDR